MKNLFCFFVFVFTFSFVTTVMGGDDPSIQGKARTGSHDAMKQHVAANAWNGYYIIYDWVEGDLKRLNFKGLHSGIVKKGEFYVSCADFTDDKGNEYDIDFLVAEKDGEFMVFQALIHKRNSEKREYKVED